MPILLAGILGLAHLVSVVTILGSASTISELSSIGCIPCGKPTQLNMDFSEDDPDSGKGL